MKGLAARTIKKEEEENKKKPEQIIKIYIRTFPPNGHVFDWHVSFICSIACEKKNQYAAASGLDRILSTLYNNDSCRAFPAHTWVKNY